LAAVGGGCTDKGVDSRAGREFSGGSSTLGAGKTAGRAVAGTILVGFLAAAPSIGGGSRLSHEQEKDAMPSISSRAARSAATAIALTAAAGAVSVANSAHAQSTPQAVQWRTQDGGNGHWYQVVVVPEGISWTNAKATASSRGGYLASVRSTPESNFLKSIIANTPGAFVTGGSQQAGPWIGASRVLGTSAWQWMSSEGWGFTNWCAGEPNGGSGEPYVHFVQTNPSVMCWNDREDSASSAGNPSFVLETHTRPTGPSEPVQWAVSQGGNGHWYELVVFSASTDWTTARTRAEARGGHLATLTSAAENSWVFTNIAQFADGWWCGLDCYGPWLGGYQDRTAGDFSEPGGGWRWITGEPWSYAAWEPNWPNNAVSMQDYLHFYGPASPTTFFTPAAFWDDTINEGPASSMVVEYGTDCNSDGIVDYGQCRDGSLPDYDGNNIPDCCEQGVPCEIGAYAFEWPLSNGGNGHWYSLERGYPSTWTEARQAAVQVGGHLATFSNSAEWSYICQRFSAGTGYWIGYYQDPPNSPVSANWRWVTGEPTVFSAWWITEPNDWNGVMQWVVQIQNGGCSWDDVSDQCCNVPVIEWDADCNGDGIVDFGQILRGELADTNQDGVPNICQCPGDVTLNDVVDGVDLAAVLGAWGTSGQAQFRTDIDNDGIVSGADLAFVLSGWGPCP
jgi:hypothetical protein